MIEYEDKSKLIPQDKYLFSATSLREFEYNPNSFFRKVIKKEKIPFFSNESVLGTIIHYFISENFAKREFKYNDVLEYFDSIPEEFEINTFWVDSKFKEMKDKVLSYVNGLDIREPDESEGTHILQLTDNVYLGGTLDYRLDNLILDFKTTSKLTLSEDEPIPEHYLNQLYIYSYILHQKGIPVDKVGIVWLCVPETNRISSKTGKPMKDYPCRCFTKIEYLKQERMDLITNKLKLVSETIEYILANPESFKYFARDLEYKDDSNRDRCRS